MHVAFTSNLYIAGSLVGYSIGLVITVLLLVLTVQASCLPGTPRANIQCALCALIWNLGGFAHTVVCALGSPKGSPPALYAAAIQFTAAATWPLPLLSIWSPLAQDRWQKIGSRVLQVVALISAGAITTALWVAAALGKNFGWELTVKELTSFNATLLLVTGGVLLLRGRMTSRVTRFASATIVVGVLATSLGIVIQEVFQFPGNMGSAVAVVSEQATLLILLGAFFLFGRFRFADVFIRYSVRILLASCLAVLLILAAQSSPLAHLANLTKFPVAIHMFALSMLAAALSLSFLFLDHRSRMLVSRWVFEAPDYRKVARELGENLAQIHDESETIFAAEKVIRTTLELERVEAIRVDAQPETDWPIELKNGEVAELDVAKRLRETLSSPNLELLVPVRSAGHVSHILAVSPGPARRALVSEEVNFLRTVATSLGTRFDSLRLERETIERRSREALLLQQVTEAELRALRAQINPHFLFNSLNTIANLIEANPPAAETMTLRLARVFRYVLSHSSHATTSIHEEMEFLRTYLEIEEARFGDRLRVQIDVAPEAATEHIPSLLLQPIVENALKHGLAPKVGPGCLWISAQLQGDQLCLKVEDNGVGSEWTTSPKKNGNHLAFSSTESKHKISIGVGLGNIAARLDTLYQSQAHLNLEGRENGGTCVTLLLPRTNGTRDS